MGRTIPSLRISSVIEVKEWIVILEKTELTQNIRKKKLPSAQRDMVDNIRKLDRLSKTF
jgi:hypothetical protein